MDATTIAVDLAKDVFEVAIANRSGRVSEHRRLTRAQFERFVSGLSAGGTVVMEACGTAQYWGQRCQAQGLTVRLLPCQYVRPYVRRNKTDRTDAEALLEANRCGGLDPVPVKTIEQQALQTVHRIRQQWQRTRVARINGLRAALREFGVAVPNGVRAGLRRIALVLAELESPVPPVVRRTLHVVFDEVRALDQQIRALDRELTQTARTHPHASRIHQVSGIGVLTATAFVGTVANIHAFRRSRQFASWIGLTPREASSGERRQLSGISKRGDRYLRTLLTHGARAVLIAARREARLRPERASPLYRWALAVEARRGYNKATCAVANKLARIIWAVWAHDTDFDPRRPGAVTP